MAKITTKNNITSNNLNLITFHQINLQHSKLATHELVKQLEGLGRFIVLAQEPFILYYGVMLSSRFYTFIYRFLHCLGERASGGRER